MCGIFGFLKNPDTDLLAAEARTANARNMMYIMLQSRARGRDGIGYEAWPTVTGITLSRKLTHDGDLPYHPHIVPNALIGNVRAEPTTEFVKEKQLTDQQPYLSNSWNIVHNGTIANDAELRDHTYPSAIDSSAILEVLNRHGLEYPSNHSAFTSAMLKLKGSFAVLAYHTKADFAGRTELFYACNYRPIWWAEQPEGVYFASDRSFFPKAPGWTPQMIIPYSMGGFSYVNGELRIDKIGLLDNRHKMKALVVCSGGLDSAVAAAIKVDQGYDVSLLHFEYGSRAQAPEIAAVQAVGAALGVPVVQAPLPIYRPSDSPLLRADSAIAGGEAGAEFAHEWVPARNLVLLAVATAYAEANGFDELVLGNNMEEAGAYPDNEPEFIHRFNDLLPFAVGANKQLKVSMPVGGMMKHEIVAQGLALKAPLDKTWSCYRAGEKHCGTCGPCYMRRTAFKINGAEEVITYEND